MGTFLEEDLVQKAQHAPRASNITMHVRHVNQKLVE